MGGEEAIQILVADDDLEDCMLLKEAWQDFLLINNLSFVHNGEELLDYLHKRGEYKDAPRPDLILLDLNMPKKDGREALIEIKADSALKSIPIVVLTTSSAEEDINKTYQRGISGFITKPVTFDGLVAVLRTLKKYWVEIVKLPPNGDRQ
ncbi:MAG: response regulator [Nitrospinota bacterium]|nr:response regulator [Nitrospinota bacterium]